MRYFMWTTAKTGVKWVRLGRGLGLCSQSENRIVDVANQHLSPFTAGQKATRVQFWWEKWVLVAAFQCLTDRWAVSIPVYTFIIRDIS